MKDIYSYYIDECEGLAAPATTIGMGNPSAPTLSPVPGDVEGSEEGSGDVFTAKSEVEKVRRKKKMTDDSDDDSKEE